MRQIHTQLDAGSPADPSMDERVCYRNTLCSSRPASEDEVHDGVSEIFKTCELDPRPGQQIVQCLDALVPVITAVTIMRHCQRVSYPTP